jgi:hypothetical protein
VAMLIAVACTGILTGNAFASGLAIVGRAASLACLIGVVCVLVLLRSTSPRLGGLT